MVRRLIVETIIIVILLMAVSITCNNYSKYNTKCVVEEKRHFRIGEIGSPSPDRIGSYYGIKCKEGYWFSNPYTYDTCKIGDSVFITEDYY